MAQGLQAKVPAPAGVWVEAKAKVEAEWVDHLLQDRADNAFVRNVDRRFLTLPDSPVMRKAVPNVVRK